MKDCHELMTSGYDIQTLNSNAYKIKEMGDGFICSVGFPFTHEGSIENHAYRLAEKFVDAFQRNVNRYFKDDKVYCGVGLASGEVTGYFPKTGLKQYDLYGDAIVLATRYEAFRKEIFASGVPKSNIITIQSQIVSHLDEKLKNGLTVVNLDKKKIRDDALAEDLHYKTFECDKNELGASA